MIPPIPPPTWTPAVVKTFLGSQNSSSGPSHNQAALGNQVSDCEDESDGEACSFGALAKIDAHVSELDTTWSKYKRNVHVAEYIDAVGELSKEMKSEKQDFERPAKRARGNHGFFVHLRDQRCLTPRMPNEEYHVYQDRLHTEARRTWNATGTYTREQTDFS